MEIVQFLRIFIMEKFINYRVNSILIIFLL